MSRNFTPAKHGFITRLAHIGLALAIVTQLATSLVMQAPEHGHTSNFAFVVHETSGLAALGFALLFWVAMVARSSGTSLGALFPWGSHKRRAALWADSRAHIDALKQLRLPDFSATSPVASAVHGLGLLLMSAMALSGTVYYVFSTGGAEAGGAVGAAMAVHLLLANLVWAYLLGHAGLALLHHLSRQMDLREMWSLRPDTSPKRNPRRALR
ncbi:MAG: cytochrome b/b6 domain-containing protein [Maritimibacter sp.]|nr:cytochrome b/b6 domain-containing protein [Maritimibacter sp.]